MFFRWNEKIQVKPKEAHKAITTLVQSKGWEYLNDVMRREITEAALALANAAPMTESEMHFRRGAMWAAVRLIELPDRLLLKLQNEVALSSAKAELGDNDG